MPITGPITGTGQAVTGLGGPAGYGETQLDRSDDGSLRIDASAVFERPLNYFGRDFAASDLWVNTNGTLSLGGGWSAYPTAANGVARPDVIGAFWADVDTRLRGEGVESGQVHVDIDTVTDCVSITWDMVGAYRRDTSSPNRFQLQLYDRGGGDFDIVLRYERLGWGIGTSADDAGARVLLNSPRLVAPFVPAGGMDPVLLDTTAGNSGALGLWVFEMRSGGVAGAQVVNGTVQTGGVGADTLTGTGGDDFLSGAGGQDLLLGQTGNDTLNGGDGGDTLNGSTGDDFLFGGVTDADIRDVLYGGDGNDSLDGGAGNDDLNGGLGNDGLVGGLGPDTLTGNAGADTLSGGGGSDLMSGNDGADYLNGGFGYDRMNGGGGADSFYHLGIPDHGSDWVQDYTAATGDVLIFGQAGATISQFLVTYAHTADAQGVRSGSAGVAEAFVIYRPTGQIIWALVDGAGQGSLYLSLGGQIHDLLF